MRKILLINIFLFGLSVNSSAYSSNLSCETNSYAVQSLKETGLSDTQAIEMCRNIAQTARLLGKNEMDLFNQIRQNAKRSRERGEMTEIGSMTLENSFLKAYAIKNKNR